MIRRPSFRHLPLILSIVFIAVSAFRPRPSFRYLADASHVAREGWTKTKSESADVIAFCALPPVLVVVVARVGLGNPGTVTAVSRCEPREPRPAMLGPPSRSLPS